MTERAYDRVISFDRRSRAYPIRSLVSGRAPRSYTWARGSVLDQGSEGACVGFGVSGELAARPVPIPYVDNEFAKNLYYDARRFDEWPGEAYEGTSVLAGMKVGAERHYFDEYRWAFGLDDLILAVGYHGPAVLGLNWREGMENVDEAGLIHATGQVVGGHCVYLRGVSVKRRLGRITNSWNQTWGVDGDALISFDDLARLLEDEGEAAIPVHRNRLP